MPDIKPQPPQSVIRTDKDAATEKKDHRTLITILLLVFVSPVGLILMWAWAKWKTWVKIVVTLLILGSFVLSAIMVTAMLVTVNPSGQIKKAECIAKCENSTDANCISLCTNSVLTPEMDNKTQETVDKVTDYFSDTGDWKEFNSAAGQFKVYLPVYPTTDTQDLTVPNVKTAIKYTTYMSEINNGKVAYFVNFSVYPAEVDTSKPQQNLEGALNGMLTSTAGSKLISSKIGTYNGYTSMDYLIQSENIYLKGKIFMVGKSMYQLMLAYEGTDNYDETDYNRFINSFKLSN